jgi:hypothetical protein
MLVIARIDSYCYIDINGNELITVKLTFKMRFVDKFYYRVGFEIVSEALKYLKIIQIKITICQTFWQNNKSCKLSVLRTIIFASIQIIIYKIFNM